MGRGGLVKGIRAVLPKELRELTDEPALTRQGVGGDCIPTGKRGGQCVRQYVRHLRDLNKCWCIRHVKLKGENGAGGHVM